ncbi:unnamed protein product [Leptosia nina]|uniref:Uncharacterized protein n=1 Tax=Leptosia nina TaxID=320188 RepID=A0AAV1J7N6_9NEOP
MVKLLCLYLIYSTTCLVFAVNIKPNQTIALQAHFAVHPTPVIRDLEGTEDVDNALEKTEPPVDITTENIIAQPTRREELDMITDEPSLYQDVVRNNNEELFTSDLIEATAVLKRSIFETTLPVPPLELIPPALIQIGGELRDWDELATMEPTAVENMRTFVVQETRAD